MMRASTTLIGTWACCRPTRSTAVRRSIRTSAPRATIAAADRRSGSRGHRAGTGHPQLRRARPGDRVLVQRAGRRGRPERRPDPGRAVGLAAGPATPSVPRGRWRWPGSRCTGAETQLPARRPGHRPGLHSPQLDRIFDVAGQHDLVVHVHTSPGGTPPTSTRSAAWSTWYARPVAVHLVHFGGGMSGHIKLVGSRFFDWIGRGKRVYTDLSWAIGFAPALAGRGDRAGAALGHDRVLFASDQPWGDFAGRARAAARRDRRRGARRTGLPGQLRRRSTTDDINPDSPDKGAAMTAT